MTTPSAVRGTRVLVVDDDPDDRELMERAARRGGYETLSVRDGISAIEAIAWFEPDVVLVDWLLPDISGAEICRRTADAVRVAGGPPRPRLVLVTARSDDLDVEIGLAHGADAFVTKPVRRQRILDALSTALACAGRREPPPAERGGLQLLARLQARRRSR